MKTLIMALFLAAGTTQAALAQQKQKMEIRSSDVPQAVMSSFNSSFSGQVMPSGRKRTMTTRSAFA